MALTNEQIIELVQKYFRTEWKLSPDKKSNVLFDRFECRYDIDSSAILYSLIRKYKPENTVEIGTWQGGSTCVILKALIKNELPFIHIASEMLSELRTETAKNTLLECQMTPMIVGKIEDNLKILPEEIDFLFVDTNHDRATTEWIAENIWPRIVKGGVFSMHDWAVWEEGGVLKGKGDNEQPALSETEYLFERIKRNTFPFEKMYWSYNNPAWDGMNSTRESGFWKKI